MIRNFIYLDSGKLRSYSSQIFEGVTEQVVSHNGFATQKSESQKGPLNSGRLLADIFSQENSSSELKFLEDHAYTLFEDKLFENKSVTDLNIKSGKSDILTSFVRVTGNLTLNDLAASCRMLKNFNDFGEAMWRITNEPMLSNLGGKISSDGEAKKKASEIGLQMHQKVADAAATLLDFGFQGLLEAHVNGPHGLFSAPLKRQFLREPEEMLVHKYSRVTEIDFTILGLITQRGRVAHEEATPPDVKDADGIKEAMRALSLHLRTVENFFSAPSSNEIIIDPIAIFSVL
ncbi:hypothetical protein P1X14_16160 [Sphingomonas sp. AOB5]|uniref:DUF6414 family protein n=1 Tax=Sphingomonas sp. AOB5 TaxID=3034017 RepID=UPI0023F87BA7|nr:hypothetical protein [Sphingomonas sp. AOB5]MDF7776791.1 hypothetical protein [Sphingomonas sp. AOB5]